MWGQKYFPTMINTYGETTNDEQWKKEKMKKQRPEWKNPDDHILDASLVAKIQTKYQDYRSYHNLDQLKAQMLVIIVDT